MAKYSCVFMLIAFFYICISLAELCFGATNITNECLPGDKDVQVTIVNKRDEKGKFHSQIKFEETVKEYPYKKNVLQFNIDHDSTCQTAKCEPPRPFYELIPEMGYYKLHTNFKNWHSAKLVCEREGTHLAIMNSLEEVGVLQEFWRRQPRQNNAFIDDIIYLGFDDIGTEGVWKTIFNQPLTEVGYMEWEPGQPVNTSNEDCGCIYAKSGKLHDCICSDVLPFFCEKEL